MGISLKQKQIDAIIRMLNLNAPNGGHNPVVPTNEEAYKVLLLDRFCRDMISPLLKVNDLRKCGVTLHLQVEADRQSIPGVPAIYFVRPTSANIQRIIQDATRGLYDKLYLNFTSSLPRPLLEELAAGILKGDCLDRIARVYDQFTEFICLENGLFSLAQPRAYVQLNDPTVQDSDVESTVEAIVGGLFCVFATLGVVPLIRAPSKGPAEMVARQLDDRIRSHLVSPNNVFKEASQYGAGLHQRPLLCIVDRNFELAVGVQHSWTYRPLVHDILGLKLNRCVLRPAVSTPSSAARSKASPTSYELDERDTFWVDHSSSPFPKAAEEVDVLLKKWKVDKEKVNQTSSGGEVPDDALFEGTKQLTAAMNAVPEMVERKRTIDKHVNIGGALLDEIKARAIDAFFTMEEDLLTRGAVDKSTLLDLLRKHGNAEDKLRLALVYLIALENPASGDADAAESALKELQVDISALVYLRHLKRINRSLESAEAGSRDDLLDWANRLYGQSISRVTAGVKNLLSTGRQLALTQAIDALMEAKPGPENESFLLLDPRSSSRDALSATAPKGPFREAIVFVIGGGNYVEYGGIQELAKKYQPPKNIVYGCTDLLSGTEFTSQLAELGQKIGSKVGL